MKTNGHAGNGVKRGFAAMDPAKVRAIAAKGGRAAHEAGTAHEFTSAEAREAGKKGGNAPHRVRGKGKRVLPKAQTALPDMNLIDEDGACADLEALSE